MLDAGASNIITTLLPGAPAGSYTIDLMRDVALDNLYMVARSSAAGCCQNLLTSWNNSFTEEIAWMADVGISTACAATSFCPKSSVSRAQMAVFLFRAEQAR